MTTLETLTQNLHECSLPAGWRMVRLGELIAEAQAGFASGERDSDGVIQLRMNNVDTRGNLVWNEVLRVPADAVTIEQYRLIPGDVVFNNTNSTELVGKSALFQGYGEPVVFSNHFTRIRPKPGALLPAFLAAWLNHQWLKGVFANICNRWVGQSAVKGDRLVKMDFPLPPFPEQKRIAATLREQMAAVEKARKAAQARLEAAKALPAAFLREVFDAAKWPEIPLRDGLRAIEAGTSVQSQERPACDGEWGVLKVSAVSWGRFKPDENKAVPPGFVPKPHEKVRLGDLLISRANTQELAGAVVLVRETPERLMLSDKTLRLVLREDVLYSEYVEFAIRTRCARKFIEHNATGTSYSMRNISQETIRAIPLPVPPLPDQKRVAAELSRRMSDTERLAEEIRHELAAIDALPAALLRQAFSGK